MEPVKGSQGGGTAPVTAGSHSFQETALGLRAYRQQLIASNIANADTPNYKAVDIDFRAALRIAQAAMAAEPTRLLTTSPRHMPTQASNAMPSVPLKYHVPNQPSIDGNTVDMDVERAKFADNAIMYQFTLDRVSGHYKHMMELFNSLKD